ncbi:SDR family oxidoreductase, partial [Rossellomorea vietnamensis]|uniref:SDR family oxidoreductase n=1 Tax=Rossellomorea vietnamensis TaxID=218284 RepID=UPI001E597366
HFFCPFLVGRNLLSHRVSDFVLLLLPSKVMMKCKKRSKRTVPLLQEAGRHMVAQGGGKIINTASLLSFQGGLTVPAYAAAKGGVAQLTKALSNEWAKDGVNVNAIVPGYIATDMNTALIDDPIRSKQILDRIPADRWGDPDDFKGTVVYLASEASNYVHGHLLAVDGGWLGR